MEDRQVKKINKLRAMKYLADRFSDKYELRTYRTEYCDDYRIRYTLVTKIQGWSLFSLGVPLSEKKIDEVILESRGFGASNRWCFWELLDKVCCIEELSDL